MKTGPLVLLMAMPVVLAIGWATEPGVQPMTAAALEKAYQDGNYLDAYQGYRARLLDARIATPAVAQDLRMAVASLQQLNRAAEIDSLLEDATRVRPTDWRLLAAVGHQYIDLPHFGFMVAGEFRRGEHRGGGDVKNSSERDRVRALQLLLRAMPLALKDNDHRAVAAFFWDFAQALLNHRGYEEAWRLQYLTDVATLPDYEDGWPYGTAVQGAPVDEDGNPVYHRIPRSFEAAQSDGERWRWCLAQTVEFDPSRNGEVQYGFATFLNNQFGVETLRFTGIPFGRGDSDGSPDRTGTFALHTLADDETIARLATGVKRFRLPDEFNFVAIYRRLGSERHGPHAASSLEQLAAIYENRRQYPKAAAVWRELLERFDGSRPQWKDRLAQIVGDWGRFLPGTMQPAGQGAAVDFRFRNAKSVDFVAREVNVAQLLGDVKAYLKSAPGQIDGNRLNIADIGYRLVVENQSQYLGREAARWTLPLEPRPDHFDRRMTVTTPLQRAGAYLLSATVPGGNTSHIIVWVADTAIVKKPLDGRMYYYVADAVSGQPVARANVEFFGFRQEYRDPGRFQVLISQFAEYSDNAGQVVLDSRSQPSDYQWIATATTAEGRFAYLGFTGVWYGQRQDTTLDDVKAFAITDRPVYRPDQPLHYKFWVRRARYDLEGPAEYAGRQVSIDLYNAKQERVVTRPVKLDEYGGTEGTWQIPADAPLGVYRLVLRDSVGAILGMLRGDEGRQLGSGHFRVEEYKKPEFEVTVEAPTEPVTLGETISATVHAKYYFGSPVTSAKVKYKVMRTEFEDRWYPVRPWDWLYGPGYWWFAADYDWYPGWRSWGQCRPVPVWWPRGFEQPELVAEREVEIGEDGSVTVEIDTALAKEIHGDQDHKYTITAEVVDQSRRTIVGQGQVLAARKPFEVRAWVDRGYYRVGDTIRASFAARTLDGRPVAGKGKLTLFRVTYGDGKPRETALQTFELATDPEGSAEQTLEATEAGQYRLSYAVTDAKEHTIEGGYLFTVTGPGFSGSDFRFDSLELVPDKAEYRPGETVNLMVNTDRAGAVVLLFVRPVGGTYPLPKLLRLDGKSAVEEIAVAMKDMPNFFIEAVTLANGKVHTATKEIVVPPVQRVMNVAVEPSKDEYRPGESASAKIRLTDMAGRPVVGSAVVAIYDKSVEYISGGSNVAEIKEFFWKWRRDHHPQTESSLDRYFDNVAKPDTPGMADLGVFGGTVAEELDALELSDKARNAGRRAFGVTMARAAMAEGAAGAMPPVPAAMAADAAEPAAPQGSQFAMAKGESNAPGEAGLVQPAIRSEFADTALWVGSLETAADGTADVELKMPENLTAWRVKAWAMGDGTRVGEGSSEVVTRKNVVLRLQAPRFFVEKDEVVLSANVHNYLKDESSFEVALELEGNVLEPLEGTRKKVEIAANGESRVDWRVRVRREGEAVVRMLALGSEESDAMEMRFPAYVHGMLKTESVSGAIRPDAATGRFTVAVPAERRADETRLEVRYSPTLAGAMVDALPYLADFPYGCTEQTLSRFLPTVITQKILIQMGLNLKEIQSHRTNLNAQEIGEAGQRAAGWKRFDRNPVFDEEQVRRMVKEGVARLTEMQLSDGGWGWFSGYGEYPSAHMTAYIVHGLTLARANDVALVPGTLERGIEWLKRYELDQVSRLRNALVEPKKEPWKTEADNIDALVHSVLAEADVLNGEMRDFLYRDRTKLSLYGLSLLGLAFHEQGDAQRLEMVLQNVSQFVVEDDENQTAWLNMPQGGWWYWWGDEIEAHAAYLKLLSRTDPKGRLASRLVKYLLNNRKNATYWKSTRDTAMVIEAMAEYLKASGEDRPDMTVEVWLDGKRQQTVEITAANLFRFDNTWVLEGDALAAGKHEIELRKTGKGPVYYNAYLTNFTLEDYIERAGLEIRVNRAYYRLRPVEASVHAAGSRGQAVDQRVEKYRRDPLADLALLRSGDLVEIELEIDSKNDYEYLVFEDMKPAGFEPVDLRSGYNGNAMGAYVEFRDNRVAFFVRNLARGKHSLSYRMRAEIPGRFSALPTRGWAMYAPELRANSDEIKLRVED